jgi:CCR4-NOT transcription complex subunit 1
VVERSVTIAGISTKELVTKDFATEPNEETLRQAAHRMAQKLAGSLALVTCKEPLRSNLSSHVRQFLNEQGFTEVSSLISPPRPIRYSCIFAANGTRPSRAATCPR